jgi:cell division protein FtsL
MTRRAWLLVAVVAVSAVLVVELRHENRVAFAKLQSLQQQRDALDVEWGKLLLEEGAWAQHRRVESTARKELSMRLPQSDQVVMVDLRQAREVR